MRRNAKKPSVIKMILKTIFVLGMAIGWLFTAVSLAAGFKGGEIVPAFFVGSTFGCVMAPLLGLNPAAGAAIGFVAYKSFSKKAPKQELPAEEAPAEEPAEEAPAEQVQDEPAEEEATEAE